MVIIIIVYFRMELCNRPQLCRILEICLIHLHGVMSQETLSDSVGSGIQLILRDGNCTIGGMLLINESIQTGLEVFDKFNDLILMNPFQGVCSCSRSPPAQLKGDVTQSLTLPFSSPHSLSLSLSLSLHNAFGGISVSVESRAHCKLCHLSTIQFWKNFATSWNMNPSLHNILD